MNKTTPDPTLPILKRIIHIPDTIQRDGGHSMVKSLLDLEEAEIGPILMLINSGGGDVPSTLAVLDTVQIIRSPIYTLAIGRAASCGALLLLAGEKRFVTPNAQVLIHSIRSNFSGAMDELSNQYRDRKRVQGKIEKFVATRTGLSRKKVQRLMKEDRFLRAKEAVRLGFADRIVTDINEIV